MTTFMNKGPNGYKPFGPQQSNLYSNAGRDAESIEVDSLYFLYPEREITDIATITDYQEWAEVGWKTKHGTYEAACRFTSKLTEEAGELREADEIFENHGSNRDSEHAAELLSELGDVLWCSTALASNSSADIDAAMKLQLYEYTMGTANHRHYQEEGTISLHWRDVSVHLATKQADISLSEISGLMAHGFEPLASPARNVDDEPDIDVDEHIDLVMFDAWTLRCCVDQQYTYGETDSVLSLPESYHGKAKDIAAIVAEIYLNIAYIASKRLGLTLDDVVAKNMAKINARIKAKRVDKSDGARDAELL